MLKQAEKSPKEIVTHTSGYNYINTYSIHRRAARHRPSSPTSNNRGGKREVVREQKRQKKGKLSNDQYPMVETTCTLNNHPLPSTAPMESNF